MPFTSEELVRLGKASIDFYLRNKPIDQIGTPRPLMERLIARQKSWPGGKSAIQTNVRKTYDSNFQWTWGGQTVSYNSRNTLEQVYYPWRSWHDGFMLSEDELVSNGITINDDNPRGVTNTQAELAQLTNLLEEHTESLRLGAEARFDWELHGDGTQDPQALEGLHKLVSVTPTTGTVGGIDASANAWWQNYAPGSALTAATIASGMEQAWRSCVKNGGKPDLILAGGTFVDVYREAFRTGETTNVFYGNYQLAPSGSSRLDAGVGGQTTGSETGLYFKGVPILWDSIMDEAGALGSVLWGDGTAAWEKRCYFLNSRHVRLQPIEGHDRVTRTPPREHNRYVWYWGLTWKGSLVCNRRNANAVLWTS